MYCKGSFFMFPLIPVEMPNCRTTLEKKKRKKEKKYLLGEKALWIISAKHESLGGKLIIFRLIMWVSHGSCEFVFIGVVCVFGSVLPGWPLLIHHLIRKSKDGKLQDRLVQDKPCDFSTGYWICVGVQPIQWLLIFWDLLMNPRSSIWCQRSWGNLSWLHLGCNCYILLPPKAQMRKWGAIS